MLRETWALMLALGNGDKLLLGEIESLFDGSGEGLGSGEAESLELSLGLALGERESIGLTERDTGMREIKYAASSGPSTGSGEAEMKS